MAPEAKNKAGLRSRSKSISAVELRGISAIKEEPFDQDSEDDLEITVCPYPSSQLFVSMSTENAE